MKFFRHFTIRKSSLPLPTERLSCLYIHWVAYKYRICKECLDKISLRIEISCVSRENKGLGNRLQLNFVRKTKFSKKTIHQFSISEVKMLLLTGNIQKAVNYGTVKRQAGVEVSRFEASSLKGFFFRSQQLTYKIVFTCIDLDVISSEEDTTENTKNLSTPQRLEILINKFLSLSALMHAATGKFSGEQKRQQNVYVSELSV